MALFIGIFFLFLKDLKTGFLKTIQIWKTILLGSLVSFLAWGSYQLYVLNTESIYGRFFILKHTLHQIVKKPWGHGFYRFATQYNLSKAAYFETPRSWKEIKNADFVYHAFNDFLEYTFEFGILWIVLILYLGGLLFKTPSKNASITIGKGCILIIALFTCTNVVAPFPIFIIVSIVCGIVILANTSHKIIYTFQLSKKLALLQLFPLCVVLFLVVQRAQAETYLYALSNSKTLKESTHSKIDTLELSQQLYKIDNGHQYVFASYILRYLKQTEASFTYLKKAFEQTKKPRIGRPLAMSYFKKGNLKEAINLLTYNKNVEPYRYEARMDLFRLYRRARDLRNGTKIAHEIYQFPIKIPSEKVTQYKKEAKEYLDAYAKTQPDTLLKGILSDKQIFNSAVLNKKIVYYTYLPPLTSIEQKIPVLYINDGIPYLKAGKLAKKVDSLIQQKIINPITLVFVEPKDVKQPHLKRWKIREELYFTNDKYNAFFTKELFPFLENRYPVLNKDRGILGVSFGGLAAAYLAIKNPKLFKNVFLQSPAFHTRKEIYKIYQKTSKPNFNVYISYGTGKDTQRQDEPFIAILKRKKYKLTVNKVAKGNHTWKVWEKQLNDILIQYYGKGK